MRSFIILAVAALLTGPQSAAAQQPDSPQSAPRRDRAPQIPALFGSFGRKTNS